MTAVHEWLQISGLDKVGNGPLLRHVDRNGQVGSSGLNPASIKYIVKKLLGNAGLKKEAYSAHSCGGSLILADIPELHPCMLQDSVRQNAKPRVCDRLCRAYRPQ